MKSSGSLSNKQYKKIKAVGSRPGVLHSLSKVHKAIVDVCPPFRPIMSAKEIVEEDRNFYMGSLDVDSLFTNIPLEETSNICTELICDQNDSIEGLNKSEFK